VNPILFVVDDRAEALGQVERDLRKRYSADYDIVVESSAVSALGRLETFLYQGEQVALLLAAQWMPEMTGLEYLTCAHRICADAKRILLIEVGDVSAEQPIARALTLNQLDFYIGKPWASPEEEFYPVTGEALRDWARMHLPRYEKVKIVADGHSRRARQLRDWLERNTVASGSYVVDAHEGRQLLTAHGLDEAHLPAVILYDGRVLVTPTEEELAGALGARTCPEPGRYDVAIVGAGPAGMAAAVYGASEGLRTVVVEGEAIGGQAGTTPRFATIWGSLGELAEGV
jgi:thioredoxin reductase (NADPH)